MSGSLSQSGHPVDRAAVLAAVPQMQALVDLVWKWNRTINLVSVRDADEIWSRHVLDSWPLADFCGEAASTWLDVGSGGGFPALVAALRLAAAGRGTRLVMAESDRRKAAFLREAIRELGLGHRAGVVAERVERLAPQGADIVSARAVAPLGELFGLVHRQFGPGTLGLFPKGRRAQEEIAAARRDWTFEADLRQSPVWPEGGLVVVRGLRHGA